jgi:hypothetical protein
VEWLASWERVDEDVTDLAAEALLDELARGGWRVHPAEERQRRQASWREQHTHPGGRGFLIGGDTGRWLWLRDFVLVDPPSGVLATDSRGDPPSEY